jgi:hypothetical protein
MLSSYDSGSIKRSETWRVLLSNPKWRYAVILSSLFSTKGFAFSLPKVDNTIDALLIIDILSYEHMLNLYFNLRSFNSLLSERIGTK